MELKNTKIINQKQEKELRIEYLKLRNKQKIILVEKEANLEKIKQLEYI